MAPSWTSTSEKPIRSIFCEFVINRIIRVYVLDLFREFIVKAISRAALDNFFRVQRFWNVRSVSFVENFTHVNPIVLTPAPPPLNCIASRLVPSRQFHQGQVRIMVTIYVNQSDFHLSSPPISAG